MPNLIQLKPSRPKPQAGDVFRMHHSGGGWLFGRIVRETPLHECAPGPTPMLVYVYAGLRESDMPEPAWLSSHSLLIPPVWTNGLAWRRGYYETVAQRPFEEGELRERHVFWTTRNFDGVNKFYVDECRNEVPAPADGFAAFYGITSYVLIDDMISDALGVPRAPIDEDADLPATQRSLLRSGVASTSTRWSVDDLSIG